MRAALVIAGKDLRQRLRDRSAIVLAFVAPFVLAVIISFAFGSGFADNFDATFAVADADASPLSTTFTTQVLGAPQLRDQFNVRREPSVARVRELIQRDEIAAGFVIPKGFGAAVTSGRRTGIDVLRNPDQQIGSTVAEAIATTYTDQINASRLSIVTTMRASGGAIDQATLSELGRQAASQRIPVALTNGRIGVRDVSGANYFGPAMAIFFLFFTTGFAARSLLAERQTGTLPRILAAPIPRVSVSAGKALSSFALGVTSMAVVFLSLGLLFDVSWGDPVAIVALSLVTVFAVMGLSAVVQLLARTQEQADAYSSMAAVVFALAGGNFFPLFQLPVFMQRVSLITPNGWALRGFSDIAYDGATIGDLGPHLAVIAAFGLVTGSIAVYRSRRLAIS